MSDKENDGRKGYRSRDDGEGLRDTGERFERIQKIKMEQVI